MGRYKSVKDFTYQEFLENLHDAYQGYLQEDRVDVDGNAYLCNIIDSSRIRDMPPEERQVAKRFKILVGKGPRKYKEYCERLESRISELSIDVYFEDHICEKYHQSDKDRATVDFLYDEWCNVD